MIYTKTKFSKFLWFIFTCITGVMLTNYVTLLLDKYIKITNHTYVTGFIILFIALAVCLFLVIRKICVPAIITMEISERAAMIFEISAASVIFVIGLLYRIFLILNHVTMGNEIVETNYCRMAVVRAGAGVKPLVHGASYVYVRLLSLFFTFFGNKATAAVWLQVALQLITILLAYFAIRKIAGRISACVVELFLAVSAVYSGQVLELVPDTLFLMLYVSGLFIAVNYIYSYYIDSLSRAGEIRGAVFSGIVIGALTYLDAVSLTLLILFIGLLIGKNKINADDLCDPHDIYVKTKRRRVFSVWIFILTLAVAAAALAVSFVLDSVISHTAVEVVYNAWSRLYTGQPWLVSVISKNNYSLIEFLAQVVLASLLVITFWKRKEVQNSSLWMLMMIILAPMPISGVSFLRYQVFYVFIWSVLAGLGLQQSFEISEADREKVMDRKLRSAMEEIAEEQHLTVPVNSENPSLSGSNVSYPADTAVSAAGSGNGMVQQTQTRPGFIENPLPLPKRHERRELDYQYAVPEHKMKYDIEVADDDDFDL